MPSSSPPYTYNRSFPLTHVQLHDTPGKEEVIMTRQFGDEQIRLSFSIADLNGLDADADPYGERALGDEEDDEDMQEGEDSSSDPLNRGPIPSGSAQSGGAQSKQTVNAGRTKDNNIAVAPEDGVAPADRPELANNDTAEEEEHDDMEGEQEPSFPARVNVVITKPGRGALQIETVAQDGMIVIDNVFYHADAGLAMDESPETSFKRRQAYSGPPFGNLDEDLQVLLERYLDERGVNTALALFVPDYIDFKEQREYLDWLSSESLPYSPRCERVMLMMGFVDVKSFIEA